VDDADDERREERERHRSATNGAAAKPGTGRHVHTNVTNSLGGGSVVMRAGAAGSG
jgi:hypothetical protein